ncbi:hypothetical protein BGZ47_008175, partial [Haplosporangium gracile]
MERNFNLYLERKRGLDGGSLKALKASDTYWNERTCHDYGQAADVVDEGVALRHALHEDRVEGISRSPATGDINLDHLQELNQRTNWSSGTIDVLARFDLFANHQGSSDYSLAKDRIADLTLMGEFTAVLSD